MELVAVVVLVFVAEDQDQVAEAVVRVVGKDKAKRVVAVVAAVVVVFVEGLAVQAVDEAIHNLVVVVVAASSALVA